MDSDKYYQLYKDAMDEVKALIKDVKKDIADNYREFGETKIKVNTLETKLEDYTEVKKAVRLNSRVTWLLGGLFLVALTVLQIWGGK